MSRFNFQHCQRSLVHSSSYQCEQPGQRDLQISAWRNGCQFNHVRNKTYESDEL